VSGYGGDGGAASDAELNAPVGIVNSAAGVYIADSGSKAASQTVRTAKIFIILVPPKTRVTFCVRGEPSRRACLLTD